MDAKEEKVHVVLVPYPAQGHLAPVIHLAKRMAGEGMIVTLINVDSIHRNLLSRGWRCPPQLDIRLEQVRFDLDIPAGVDAGTLSNPTSFVEAVERMQFPFEELISRLTPTPCCVISDYFLRWGVGVTRRLSFRVVTFWPGNAAWSSLHHHLDMLLSNGDACEDFGDDQSAKLISYIPGLQGLTREDLPSYYRKKQEGLILDFFRNSADRMKDADWILVNSIFELETHTFNAMQAALTNRNFVSVGPLFPAEENCISHVSLRSEDTNSLSWLDNQEEQSVLYISFGSISIIPECEFKELAAGLEASNQPFLWVVLQGGNCSNGELLKGFNERTRKRGLVVRWAPQLKILAHRATGGFLSHCGWNSTVESIFHGIPILCWPCRSEQGMNSKLIVEWGIGKRLYDTQHGVDRKGVEKMIREFMRDEQIRKTVKELKETVRSTAREGGSSHTNLRRFMQSLKEESRAVPKP